MPLGMLWRGKEGRSLVTSVSCAVWYRRLGLDGFILSRLRGSEFSSPYDLVNHIAVVLRDKIGFLGQI